MSFRLTGLPAEPFQELFALSDAELAQRRACRMVADSNGYPCRISLTDAPIGAEVILVNYEHQTANTPYRSNHALFVREGETQYDAIDEVPDQLRRRLLSVRGFDNQHMLRDADVTEGKQLEAIIERFFADPAIDYLHVHMARPGCYAARVDRA
ncbi:MAG TPA: DUF1203 domain-containing protein [Dyella sp.]|uniref:DUF1203 domain-containing protein n=1 Tax=Dyella sp. TaxID=1869338 RepID=UPI002F91E4B8